MAAADVQQLPSLDATTSVDNPVQVGILANPTTSKRDVAAVLNYHKPNEDGSAPEPVYVERPETYNRTYEKHDVTIHDVTGDESKFSLDGNGFAFYRHTATEKDFVDDAQIEASYYEEVKQLLKDATGASRVFVFDHTIRRRLADTSDKITDRDGLRGPALLVHVDQSNSAGPNRVRHHLPDEADKLLKGRVQIINVWRPIKTVYRDPLAVADANTIQEEDLVTRELIYPDRVGETYVVKHSPGHSWHYKRELTPDEVILLKCYDSKEDGRARRAPHTAFVDGTAAEDAPARESIEVRTLVFHEDDTE